MESKFFDKIRELERKLPEMLKRVPGIIRVEGLQFIADNFEREGFETKTGKYSKWKPKLKKGAQKKILVGEKRGGSLMRSWEQETFSNDKRVAFGSSLPYAQVHNEGGKAGRGKGFMMPQRQMIGPSEAIDKRVMDKIDRIMDSVFD